MTEEFDIDSCKLMYHPERVAEWKLNGDCFPIYVEIGPTNRCNHRCVFCCYDFFVNKSRATLDRDIALRTLEELAQGGAKSVMFAGDGEPLLHNDIGLFTQRGKKFNLDLSMTTNGVLLNQKNIDGCLPNLTWIRTSLDAGSSENYARIHQTNSKDFEKVLYNLKQAAEFKRENNLQVTIGTQFLLIPQNVNEVLDLARRLKDIGVDNLQIKPYSQNPNSINKFVINYEDYSFLEEPLEKIKTPNFKIIFRKQTMKRVEEGNIYPKCYGLPFFALIDAKGDVLPCSLFYDRDDFTYGNLYNLSFSEIWKSDRRKKVMAEINKDISQCRHGCRLDPSNRYLHRVKNPKPHDNFF